MNRIAISVLALVALTGCGTEPDNPPNVVLLPLNDTPEHTVQRLIATYENKRAAEFAGLFTGDYRYQFSNATDPDLVVKYAGGWFKTDEDTSARHLFLGGKNRAGDYQPAATSIEINFAITIPVNDPANSDTAHFKMLYTRVDGYIVVPTSPDPTTYLIQNNTNRFFFVRGDFAGSLGSSQPADSAHWYIYRWVDETQQTVRALGRHVIRARTRSTTWGSIKAAYR